MKYTGFFDYFVLLTPIFLYFTVYLYFKEPIHREILSQISANAGWQNFMVLLGLSATLILWHKILFRKYWQANKK